ncbi:MAG TPA: MOSC domain-containing protein [Gaiellaceae bacterium]|nr:MOSC domain-containing protein [Gaiellaceae bacterium]
MRSVARISVSAVKGFRLQHPERVELGPDGVPGNRRFFLVDADGQRLRSSATPWLAPLGASYDARADRLTVRLPDGRELSGSAAPAGPRVHSTAGSLEIRGSVVEGPWTAPLSELAGAPVRLARADPDAVTVQAPVTLVSDGSLARATAAAGLDRLDSRRFRMLFELAGCGAHEEDAWEGRLVRIGGAVVRVGEQVVRCAVTTRDPDTGARDHDLLRVIAGYRGRREPDGAVLFGVYAHVESPGPVRVGDPVELL